MCDLISIPASDSDKLVAHRGYPHHYPENTLVGIEAAIQAGAKYIEVDVQLSADGVAVLFHDRDLLRLCSQPGALHDYDWQTLQGFTVRGAAESDSSCRAELLSSLKELAGLLQAHPHVAAFIELKRISLVRFGEEEMLEKVFTDLQPVLAQCVMISYSMPALAQVRKRGGQPVAVVADDWYELTQPRVQALQPEYLFCDIETLPDEGSLHIPGSRLAVYECTDVEQARAVLARGVDLVETFAIGEMLASLQKGG